MKQDGYMDTEKKKSSDEPHKGQGYKARKISKKAYQ